jgi:hypothetical protein
MIKDAIGNNPRWRSPSTAAFPKCLFAEAPARTRAKFFPLNTGRGIVDVNVLYHSAPGLATVVDRRQDLRNWVDVFRSLVSKTKILKIFAFANNTTPATPPHRQAVPTGLG